LDSAALTELARHYSVRDWDRWKRATSRDTDVSCYMELKDAVTVHPYKCLQALATTWGLQYSALERLRTPLRLQGLLGKRKAETDNGLRRIRARQGQDNSSATGSESASSQDIDGQRSQHSKVISVQIRVPSNAERRDLIERLMAAAKRDDRRRNGRYTPSEEPSEHTRLKWRVESTIIK
jgi:hypothetical protein